MDLITHRFAMDRLFLLPRTASLASDGQADPDHLKPSQLSPAKAIPTHPTSSQSAISSISAFRSATEPFIPKVEDLHSRKKYAGITKLHSLAALQRGR